MLLLSVVFVMMVLQDDDGDEKVDEDVDEV